MYVTLEAGEWGRLLPRLTNAPVIAKQAKGRSEVAIDKTERASLEVKDDETAAFNTAYKEEFGQDYEEPADEA